MTAQAARTIEYERPRLYPKQLAAIFAPERYSIIEATTKAGKTHGCLAWLLEEAVLGQSGHSYWWVAPIYTQAKIAFRRMRGGIPPWACKANETDMTLTLLNGAIIWFKSADKPDGLFGDDVYAVVVDEATRVKEDAWHAVRSTISATKGRVRIIGNVKGRKNWAYVMARRAEADMQAADRTMHYAKLTAADAIEAGIMDAAEVEDARRQLPEAVFRELYYAEPSDDGGNPFGIAAIRNCIMPLSPNAPKWWGWDLAKSVDYTVGVGLDAEGRVCRFERWQKPWQETLASIKAMTAGVKAVVDSTGVGDPIVEALQRVGSNFEGFKFTSPSKQQLMEGLAVAIQKGEIGYPEGPIVNELEAFEYEYTRTGVRYTGPEGMHDDCVCALALAVHAKGRRALETWTPDRITFVPTLIGTSRYEGNL